MKNLKRISALLIVLILAFSSLQLLALADGETAISTYEELCNISNNPNGRYYLEKDIVANGKTLTPMCSATAQFKGVLDGRGHSIVGLNINATKSENGSTSYAGIFIYNGGTIKNLNLIDVTVSAANTNYAYAGAIAAINLGTIENCYVSGVVRNENNKVTSYTGSICGQMLRGSIQKSVSYANVFALGSQQYIGGITGYNERGLVEESAMYGSIFANGVDAFTDAYCGGITGFSRDDSEFENVLFGGGIISEKFANVYLGGVIGSTTGTVNGGIVVGTANTSQTFSHNYVGGIAGNDYNATVKNSYFIKGFTNQKITSVSGKELTISAMANASSLSGIDFSSVWKIANGKPALKNIPTVSADKVSALKGIKIVSKPNKLEYELGYPALNLTGLRVNAIYNDKEIELRQNEYTVSGYNYSQKGEQTITVMYKGFDDSFVVNVKPSTTSVIAPEITEDSYYEGNSTGGKADKEPITASKTESTSSKQESTASKDIVVLEEVKEEMEEESEKENENEKEENDGSTVTTIGGADEPTDIEVEIKPKKDSPIVIILIATLVVVAAASLIIVFVKRKKTK